PVPRGGSARVRAETGVFPLLLFAGTRGRHAAHAGARRGAQRDRRTRRSRGALRVLQPPLCLRRGGQRTDLCGGSRGRRRLHAPLTVMPHRGITSTLSWCRRKLCHPPPDCPAALWKFIV